MEMYLTVTDNVLRARGTFNLCYDKLDCMICFIYIYM
jgi:hypothetical protein